MKVGILLLGLLTSAALAATSDTRWSLRALAGAEPSPLPAMVSVDPPWLTSDVELPTELHGQHAPHAGYHDGAPHAAHPTDHGDPHNVHPHDVHPHDVHPHGVDPHGVDPHSAGVAAAGVARVEPSKAHNGRTVAAIFAHRVALNQKPVRLRATVVKLTDGILGKTYLHLQDGSGSPESRDHDLTATTTEAFELGETVEVEGLLALDQDVGLGYVYDALLTQIVRVKPL
jgi:hypothetical protein